MRKMFILGLALLLAGCGGGEAAMTEAVTAAPPASTAAQTAAPATVPPTTAAEPVFASAEEAYYAKYLELAAEYGTPVLYDIQDAQESEYYRLGRSYLGGVCVVSLMDFDGDGAKDLFVVYANGRLKKKAMSYASMGHYEFPDRNSYEYEAWAYEDGALRQLFHERTAGEWGYTDYLYYYQNGIAVFENADGAPVVQCYSGDAKGCEYMNLFMEGGEVVRETLTYRGATFCVDSVETSTEDWRGRALGYEKLLLCALLSDSNRLSDELLEWYGLDYQDTLTQTMQVVRFLSGGDTTPMQEAFRAAEAPWLVPYYQVIFEANRVWCSFEENEEGEKWLTNHQYALYDMDTDGIPELIVATPNLGGGTHYHFYTLRDGAAVHCGDYGRTDLLVDGAGGVIAYLGRMGGYWIDKLELDGTDMVATFIDSNHWETNVAVYPELGEYGYEGYRWLTYCPQPLPFGFYAYDFDWEVEP